MSLASVLKPEAASMAARSFLSPTTPTDALPVSIQHDSAAVGDGRRVDVTGVGGVRRDTFAALDPDLTFDYFQAQGRLMRERMEGGLA
jgi:hypothetical protein